MNAAAHYTYRVAWSAEDAAYVATVAELPSLSWIANEATQALFGAQRLASEIVDDLIANDEDVPEPLSEREFSGKFVLRIPPELHRRLAIDAAEQRVSLNRLVSAKLAA